LNRRRHGGVQQSKLGGIPNWGCSELGAQSGRKNQPACLSFFFFSSPNLCRCRLVCPTWCGPRANLECRSEMYCTQLTENAGCKKSPSGHHRTTLSSYIFPTVARIDNRKKLVKPRYLLHMPPQYGELQPTSVLRSFR